MTNCVIKRHQSHLESLILLVRNHFTKISRNIPYTLPIIVQLLLNCIRSIKVRCVPRHPGLIMGIMQYETRTLSNKITHLKHRLWDDVQSYSIFSDNSSNRGFSFSNKSGKNTIRQFFMLTIPLRSARFLGVCDSTFFLGLGSRLPWSITYLKI